MKAKIGFVILLLLLLLGTLNGLIITSEAGRNSAADVETARIEAMAEAEPGSECSPCTNIFDDSLEPPYQVKCQFIGVGTCPEWEEFGVSSPAPNGEIFTLEQTTWCTWEYVTLPWHILWNPHRHTLGLIWFGTEEVAHYIECPIGRHQEFEDKCWTEFSDNCLRCGDLTPVGGSGRIWWVDDFYGDFNFDGIVDGEDLALFAEKWQRSILDDDYDLMYDADGDGWIDEYDLEVFASNWLKERPE